MKTEIMSVELTDRGNSVFRVLTPTTEKLIIGFMDFIPASADIVEHYKNAICAILDAYYEKEESKKGDLFNFLSRNLYRNGYGFVDYIFEDRDAVRIRIGEKIKELREKKKMDAKTLAQTTGIDAANLCRIEQGRYSVGLNTLAKIANALGCKIDLVPDDGEDNKNEKLLNIIKL